MADDPTDSWIDVLETTASPEPVQTAAAYLAQYLTDEEVHSVISKLGAVTMEDLALVDEAMATEAVSDLKLIPRKKAMDALLKAAAPAAPATPAAPAAPATPATGESSKLKEKLPAKPPKLEECVAIAIDRSGSMGTGFDEQKSWCDDGNANALKKTLEKRSRMEAVKQVFYAFRDRVETLGKGKHELGLIQFDSEIETILGLTSSLNLFEEIVDDIEKRGQTAIYSAVLEGCRMLAPVFESSPSTDLRILVLTDGQNNSGADPHTALQEVNKIGAVVDAIIVGDSPDQNLLRIVTATGGSSFQIRSLSEGFELMESEAVVSLRARRGGGDKPVYVPRETPAGGFDNIEVRKLVSGKNASSIVTCKAPTAKKVTSCGILASSGKSVGGNSASVKRIMKEITDVGKGVSSAWMHSGEGCHIFPDSDNIHLMKALITGPSGSPFVGGTFVLDIRLPNDYPFKPPSIKFETPVYHCNVSDTGLVCIDILQDKWSPALTIAKAIEAIRIMLSNPDTDNSLRQWIAELTIAWQVSGGADTRYLEAAAASTLANAGKSVDEWRVLWGLP